MSKIAIISRPDQGVLIDVSGCTTMQEAVEHLSSTLQVSSQFWKGLAVDINLGKLSLDEKQVAQLLALAKGVGVTPKEVFSEDIQTLATLIKRGVKIGIGKPMTMPATPEQELTEVKTISIEPAALDELDDSYAQVDTTGIRIVMHDGEAADDLLEPVDQSKSSANESDDAKSADSVLYLRQTLRSGQAVSHKGHLVIVGDVNAGAEVMAEGDITVWGCLRGIAHAGIGGNLQAEIRALRLQPIQIRIAHAIARSPDPPHNQTQAHWGPESARLVGGKIRIIRNSLD